MICYLPDNNMDCVMNRMERGFYLGRHRRREGRRGTDRSDAENVSLVLGPRPARPGAVTYYVMTILRPVAVLVQGLCQDIVVALVSSNHEAEEHCYSACCW